MKEKERAVGLLADASQWEDLSAVKSGPRWELINRLDKFSDMQKLVMASLLQGVSSFEQLKVESGVFKEKGLSVEVGQFWRKVSQRLITMEPYREVYKLRLDSDFKRNEKGEFKAFAVESLDRASDDDKPCYQQGKLSLTHLKCRARLYTLTVFMRDLFKAK